MSIESAKAFIERMKTDEEFRKKVETAKTKEERKKIVKDAGFEFTKAELNEVSEELTEEQLNMASAGHCSSDTLVNAQVTD
jgi:predicted ribosomally synthesized peptide with nif11-like leader